MRIFEALHEGLDRIEAGLARLGDRFPPESLRSRAPRYGVGRVFGSMPRDQRWPLIVLGEVAILLIVGLFLAPVLLPILLLAVIAFAGALFARAWVREFAFLMQLDDQAFPGQHDKLLWGLLLILVPPVGVWMFGSYRVAQWGEDKAAEPVVEV